MCRIAHIAEYNTAALNQTDEATGALQFIVGGNGKPIHIHRHIVNQAVATQNGADDTTEEGVCICRVAIVRILWQTACQVLFAGILDGEILHH